MVPNTPRAVTAGAGRGDPPTPSRRRAGRRVPRREAARRSPTAARALGLARGPAPRRRGRRLYPRRCAPCSPRRPRSGRPARSAATVPEPPARRRPHPVRYVVGGRTGGTGIAFDWSRLDGRGELGRGAPRRRAQPGQCRARRRGSAPMRSTSARGSRRRPAARIRPGSPPSSRRCGCRCAGSARHADAAAASAPMAAPIVPEILMPALEQLEARLPRRAGGSGLPGRARRPARQICRPADAADPAAATSARQGAHLSEARGSAPRRRPQDQPGARPGAARPADGQDAADRRDRRRPARRRHRAGRRPVRARDPHLHGRARRRAAAAERLPDAADGRRGGAGRRAAQRTLKDAINEALRDWAASFADTHYLLGTVAGPHPFPLMVREYQRVIGREARAQILEPRKAGCPTRRSPASAAAPTRWACSPISSATRACG